MLNYITYQQTAFAQNCRIVFNAESKNAIICDPGDNAPFLYGEIQKLNLNATAILLTHGHLDHCGAAADLSRLLNVDVIGPQAEDSIWLDHLIEQSKMFGLPMTDNLKVDRFLNDGEELDLSLGEIFKVSHCPGHTPGHVCYYATKSNFVLSGDVLFAGSVGRSDFPHGDPQTLINSINNKLLILPGNTIVLPGHGPDTTIDREKSSNPFLIPDIY